MAGVKVGTCCYCGTRAALVLRGDRRHELACVQCGAPLHDLKMLPQQRPQPVARGAAQPARVPHAPAYKQAQQKAPAKKLEKTKSEKKKSKPRGLKLAKAIWDIVDDILD